MTIIANDLHNPEQSLWPPYFELYEIDKVYLPKLAKTREDFIYFIWVNGISDGECPFMKHIMDITYTEDDVTRYAKLGLQDKHVMKFMEYNEPEYDQYVLAYYAACYELYDKYNVRMLTAYYM